MESVNSQQIINRINGLNHQLSIIDKQLAVSIPQGKRDALLKNRTLVLEKLRVSAKAFKKLFEVPIVVITYLNSKHEKHQYTTYGMNEYDALFAFNNLAYILGEKVIILDTSTTTTQCPKSL